MTKHTMDELRQWQALPLSIKVRMTEQRIRDWVNEYGEDGVYVSFSGGKDSTVLLDIVRNRLGYTNVPAVFCDTGLEFPEIRDFVKTFDNVVWLKPKMNFKQTIQTYGYPLISKDVAQSVYDVGTQARIYNCDKRKTKLWHRDFNPESDYAKKYPSYSRARYDFLIDSPFKISSKCCEIMKKKPSKEYEKESGRKPILGIMASESRQRATQWLRDGCNAYDVKRPTSKPMSFWTDQDVLQYIRNNHLPICSVYGDIIDTKNADGQLTMFDDEEPHLKTTGCSRTGCMFCMFGCSNKDWHNFETMKETHPKQYDYIMRPESEGGLNYKEVIDWVNLHGNMSIKY